MRCPLLLALGLAIPATASLADGRQALDALRTGAIEHLKGVTAASHPESRATIEVERADPRLRLPTCPAPRYFLASGSRPWGSGSIGVACDNPSTWSLYLTYRIRLRGPALLASHPIPARRPLVPADTVPGSIEYADDPGKYVRDPARLRGAVLTRPLPAGHPIDIGMLQRPPLIRAGKRVRILVETAGFQVSQEGVAQQQAAEGETVRLKTSAGRIVQGVVQGDGTVRIQP